MQKPRLAVFNTQPPHVYFGGVERRIMETSKRLRNDADITVYSGTKRGFREPISRDGMHVIPCFSTDVAFPLDNWVFNQTISRAVNRIEADIYEAHAVSGYAFLKALRKTTSKAPFIQTVHGVLADEYVQAVQGGALSFREKVANLFMWRLSRLEAETARNADLVVTVSHYSARRITQLYGVDKVKIRVVPNGVDTERFKPSSRGKETRRRYGLARSQVVLFVGRLIPRKGLSYLVEAAKLVVRARADTIFVIVGNGPLRSQLETRLRNLNLSRNFMFIGDVDENTLESLYSVADVFALPSIQEGQGIVLLEAQAAAKPVVAFDVGGVKEAVADGKSGFLIERGEGDSVRLGNAILDLLSDQTMRERMGKAGREFVTKNFTWDISSQKMLHVYEEALGSRS